MPDITYPLRFVPVYQDYIWGGDRIPRVFERELPPGIYAESWEIADRDEGMSVVANGPLAGRTLRALLQEYGDRLVGSRPRRDRFPLLIKIIDAARCLSVQVHPNNHNASLVGGEPKTELWYVLEASPGARVLVGFRHKLNQKRFRAALDAGAVADLLRVVPVSAGEVVYVPGGRVHAIDSGCLLLEIQQNSDTTYRVYDWGRVGHDGNPRQLHVEQALQVLDWEDVADPKVALKQLETIGRNVRWRLLDSPYFRVERFAVREPLCLTNNGDSFHILFVSGGRVTVGANDRVESLKRGTTCLLPAALDSYTIRPVDAPSEVIWISH